jgi:aminopeptidase
MIHIKQVGAVALAIAAGAVTSSAQPAKVTPNYVEIANRIVGTSANVKEGEIVELVGTPADMPLLEELSVACSQRGAWPMIVTGSESLLKKWTVQSIAKYDDKLDAARMALAKAVNVIISLPTDRDASIYASLPADRIAKLQQANTSIRQTLLSRNVRQIELDNGLAPSPTRAKELGIDEGELAALYWSGLAADYAGIQAKAKQVQDRLVKANELHLTLPNGTDLKLKLSHKSQASDGVITDAKAKAGGAQLLLWLPAGEVLVTPVAGTVEGKLVDDRMVHGGKEVLGVTAAIKAGKITSLTAKSGWDGIKAMYEAMPATKVEVSALDFGINPVIRTGGKLETYMGAGNVTISTGANDWAGGTIKGRVGLRFLMSGATVTLDGTPFITNGVLN